MDVSAEQPGLGSSPPGPQLELHPITPPPLLSLSFFSLFPLPLFPSFLRFLPPLLSSLLVSCRPPFPLSSRLPLFLSALAKSSRHHLHLWGRRRIESSHRYKVTERKVKDRKGERERKEEERTKEKCTTRKKGCHLLWGRKWLLDCWWLLIFLFLYHWISRQPPVQLVLASVIEMSLFSSILFYSFS